MIVNIMFDFGAPKLITSSEWRTFDTRDHDGVTESES